MTLDTKRIDHFNGSTAVYNISINQRIDYEVRLRLSNRDVKIHRTVTIPEKKTTFEIRKIRNKI